MNVIVTFARIATPKASPVSACNPDVLARLADAEGRVHYANRQFLALTGKTISDYIETYRIEQSKLLLARGDVPMKQVAAQAGFSHGNSFARAFRRATGLSPREYRQRSAALTE